MPQTLKETRENGDDFSLDAAPYGRAIIAALLMAVLAYFLAARSLPDYTKTLKVDGITASVEIVRNNANVPHIFGETDADVFFGLGYAHAQDRLWQMTMLRRTAQGRLSEVFGKRTLSIDTLLRRLDIYRLASVSVASQDARTSDALSAYAAGVNMRITEINNRSLGRGAPEMFLFGAPISPWRPADSLAVTKLMALQLSGHLQDEVLRARTSLVLPDEARLSDILPDMPGTGVAALPKYAALFDQPLPQYVRPLRKETRCIQFPHAALVVPPTHGPPRLRVPPLVGQSWRMIPTLALPPLRSGTSRVLNLPPVA